MFAESESTTPFECLSVCPSSVRPYLYPPSSSVLFFKNRFFLHYLTYSDTTPHLPAHHFHHHHHQHQQQQQQKVKVKQRNRTTKIKEDKHLKTQTKENTNDKHHVRKWQTETYIDIWFTVGFLTHRVLFICLSSVDWKRHFFVVWYISFVELLLFPWFFQLHFESFFLRQ